MAERSGQLDLLSPAADAEAGFVVRESRRARRLSIVVRPLRGVEVVVPAGTRPATVARFVSDHRDWIDRAVRELDRVRPAVEREPPARVHLAAIDAGFEVRYGAAALRCGEGRLMLPALREDGAACRRHLRRWLQATARRHLPPRLRSVSERTRLACARVHVRGQRTRWGSYSSTGTVSLNFCLLFLEPGLVDYLCLHELCHTRHMNHSPRFWRLVEQHEPRFREMERELDRAWRRIPGWVEL